MYLFDNMMVYCDNTPRTLAIALKVASESKAKADSVLLGSYATRDHVAYALREWFINESVDAFPYREQLQKECMKSILEDIQECPDWDHIEHWRMVADHYLGKIAEGCDMEWAIRE